MLELKNITKLFPGVKALDDVSVTFRPGEIHALLGENGAGKSTLIKVICGVNQPEEGEVWLDGKQLHLKDFKDAVNNNITIVNQEIQVIHSFDVAENIVADKMERFSKNGIVNWKKVDETVNKYLSRVGLGDINPHTSVKNLSTAQQQMVQIAKALSAEARVLLCDEPTSALSQAEADILYDLLRDLKKENIIIIFVSHKLEEVMALCDRITVLRDGKHVGTELTKNLQMSDVIKMMVNRDVVDVNLGVLNVDYSQKVMEVRNVQQKKTFDGLGFDLYKGEILGFYGLVGAGRTELAKILIGEDKAATYEMKINGKDAKIADVSDALENHGLGYVSENRKEEGLLLNDSVKTNIGITLWRQLSKNFLHKIDVKAEESKAQEMCTLFEAKITGLNQKVGNLSGGNQQKILISKWLAAGCEILIIDEPTIGVDVAAKEAIHNLIWHLAKDEGKSIILISSDMKEMCTLARRILVFRDFKIAGEIDNIADGNKSYNEISSMIGHYLV